MYISSEVLLINLDQTNVDNLKDVTFIYVAYITGSKANTLVSSIFQIRDKILISLWIKLSKVERHLKI